MQTKWLNNDSSNTFNKKKIVSVIRIQSLLAEEEQPKSNQFSKPLDNEDDYLYNNYTKNTGADCFSVCIGGDVYESLV